MNTVSKVDILCICAHPDDVELTMGGTVAKMVSMGHSVGIIDLTQGELGTRGDINTRQNEAIVAAKILGVQFRVNSKMKDGWLDSSSKVDIVALVKYIRLAKPSIVLTSTIKDRHPDHGSCARMVERAVFMSGLRKIEVLENGLLLEAHRPLLYYGIQSEYFKPDFIVDISDFWAIKKESILAFKSQFYDPQSSEPETFISNSTFLDFIEARAREFGTAIRVQYGEGFVSTRAVGIDDLYDLK